MSGVTILWTLLKGNAPLLALVPKERIVSGQLPEGIALPAVSVASVSAVDRNIPNPAAAVVVTQRVQASVLARNYNEQVSVMTAIRAACRDQRGTVAGFAGVSVVTDGQGPDDFFGEGTGIYLQTQDFKITFSQTP